MRHGGHSANLSPRKGRVRRGWERRQSTYGAGVSQNSGQRQRRAAHSHGARHTRYTHALRHGAS
eukprot:6673837-Prymnesium_polylepis.2